MSTTLWWYTNTLTLYTTHTLHYTMIDNDTLWHDTTTTQHYTMNDMTTTYYNMIHYTLTIHYTPSYIHHIYTYNNMIHNNIYILIIHIQLLHYAMMNEWWTLLHYTTHYTLYNTHNTMIDYAMMILYNYTTIQHTHTPLWLNMIHYNITYITYIPLW